MQRVTLRVGDDALLDFPLQVGQLNEQVEVVSTATALNRTGFEVGGSVGRTQISALPLNGRSFLELAQLQPGVTVVSVTNPGAFGNNYQRVLMSGAYYSSAKSSTFATCRISPATAACSINRIRTAERATRTGLRVPGGPRAAQVAARLLFGRSAGP